MKTAVLILAALVALLIVCSLEVFVAVVMRLQEQSDKLDENETRLNNLSEAGRITTARKREQEQSNRPNQ